MEEESIIESGEVTIGSYLDEKFPKSGSKDPEKKDPAGSEIKPEELDNYLEKRFKTK